MIPRNATVHKTITEIYLIREAAIQENNETMMWGQAHVLRPNEWSDAIKAQLLAECLSDNKTVFGSILVLLVQVSRAVEL